MPKNKQYPNNLRKYRLKRNLTQQTVLDTLGHSSPSRLSAWENGTAMPSIEHLLTLSHLYKIPVEKLYGALNRKVKNKVQKRPPHTIKLVDNTPSPVSSEEMTIEEQLNVLAQLLVEAYIDQKRQNFPHVGSSERT